MKPLKHLPMGFSLVELMVAMTIGLGLMLVVAQLFLGSRQIQATQDDLARIQEGARFVVELMAKELRMAGYKSFDSTGDFDAANPAITGSNDTGTNLSDQIQVRYFGSSNTAATAVDNTVLNCLGNAVGRDERVNDTFLIAADATNDNEPTLFCRSVDTLGVSTDNALVPGVESMQILYGMDTDGDKTANAYLKADDAALVWDSVVAVRISMLLRSSGNSNTGVNSRVYNHFGASYAPGGVAPAGDTGAVFNAAGGQLDFRMRRIFQTTITVRNRVN